MNPTSFILIIGTLCGLLVPATAETKPNIVFIMADDLGPGWVDYDDTNPKINTPNLQRLAESSMVFTNAYAATHRLLSHPRRLHHTSSPTTGI